MNNKNFAVGIFVAIALVAFVFASVWLSGRQGSEPTVRYSLYFETDVGGLMLGGPVFYLGVDVGKVTAMEIIPGNPMRVRVDIEVLQSAPVNAGTYAGLSYQGITGVAVVKLNADPGLHEDLKPATGAGYPVIEVRNTGFSAILDRAPELVEKMDSVLIHINEILGEENREFVNDVLADVSSVAEALAEQKETIAELPVLLKEAIGELNSSLGQIRAMSNKLEPGLSAAIENLEQSTRNLALMTQRMEAWTASNNSDMNAFMGDGLGQVPALISDARTTIRELEKLVKDLREDPSRLIYKPNEDNVDVEK
jgi:phospholipid/cholesterol/gamma-HCH transport system substrate-binding protein